MKASLFELKYGGKMHNILFFFCMHQASTCRLENPTDTDNWFNIDGKMGIPK